MSSMRFGVVLGCVMTLARAAAAQELDPPPAAAGDDPPPPPAAEEATPAPPAAEAASEGAAAAEPSEWDEGAAEEGEEGASATPEDQGVSEDAKSQARRESLSETSGLLGATGLMRVLGAASGAPGTFRFSLLTGYYSGSGFLCPQCPNNGDGAELKDDVDRVSANLFLSATLTSYLELYAGIFSHSTSTNRPVPQLKQVVGDWSLGAKAFMPAAPDQIFTFGGALDLGFSTGSGQVGLTGIDSLNLGVHALATADFSKRSGNALPLRAHLNVGYLFDNSAKLVEDFEGQQGRLIDRIERFSLDINRVDFLRLGLGAEGLFDTARPFLEWTIDIPANRQAFLCVRDQALSGDSCLRDRPQFSTTPSRLSAGVRVMPWTAVPWWLEGMTVAGVLDVATGGASDFLVEVAPEVPWSVWFGLGYAVDTEPRVQIQQVVVSAPTALPPAVVYGMVVEKETAQAIADAQIRFEGRDLTGLISNAEGRFVTGVLEPGHYTLRITAPGYKEGSCGLDVAQPTAPLEEPAPVSGAPSPASTRGLASSPAAVEAPPGSSTVRCELEPVPKVSNINGRVNDANGGEPIGNASVRITDVLGRELTLQVDEVGAFRFENVPPGSATITIQADGYLKSVTRFEVEPLQEIDQRFPIAPIPAKPTIRVIGKRLEPASPIVFAEGSAKLSRESLFVLQEMAAFLEQRPELGRVEIQSLSASGGLPTAALATERANAIRDALVLHGVPSARLSARGFGAPEPGLPGTADPNAPKSDRVVFLLDTGAP